MTDDRNISPYFSGILGAGCNGLQFSGWPVNENRRLARGELVHGNTPTGDNLLTFYRLLSAL
ncbi:MAG: hypothetical protein VYA55_00390 [Pseudomonadota bacterium]|nr:hypothetical protein [Pseudomonadota bacterium]